MHTKGGGKYVEPEGEHSYVELFFYFYFYNKSKTEKPVYLKPKYQAQTYKKILFFKITLYSKLTLIWHPNNHRIIQ